MNDDRGAEKPELDPSARALLDLDAALDQQVSSVDVMNAEGQRATPTAHHDATLQMLTKIEVLRRFAPELLRPVFGAQESKQGVSAGGGDIGMAALGRFRLIAQLGRGGHGIVFQAEDPRLHRCVALKVPRPEVLLTADLKRRFLREAEAAAILDHPHIVPIYETGQVGPICYIASAFIEGESLSDWMRHQTGPIDERIAAQIIHTLAGAVQHAHSRGILHRDIKPSNVLLATAAPSDDARAADDRSPGSDTDQGQRFLQGLRLTDFGLARTIEASPLETQSQEIVGTPAYMSPEQAANRREEVSVTSDLYSLGATLYHLLVGTPPHQGASVWETIRSIQETEPVPPHRQRPGLNRDLSAICQKCLEKDPQRRYQTAAELQSDLQRYLEALPFTLDPFRPRGAGDDVGPSQSAAGRADHRHGTLPADRPGNRVRRLVFHDERLRREQAAVAVAAREYEESKKAIDRYFVEISENRLLTAPGLKPLRRQLLEDALTYYQAFLLRHADDTSLTDELRKSHVRVGTILSELGHLDSSRTHFEAAYDLAVKQSASDRSDGPDEPDPSAQLSQAMILRQLAALDRQAQQMTEASSRLEQAIAIHRHLLDLDFEVEKNLHHLGLALSNLGNVAQHSGQLAESMALYEQSEQCFRQLLEGQPEDPESRFFVAQSLGNQSILARQAGDLARATELLEMAIDHFRALANDDSGNLNYQESLGKALANLSMHYLRGEQYDQAIASLRESTTAFDRLSLIHPQVVVYTALRASTRREIGSILRAHQRYHEAELPLSESVALLRKVCQESPDDARMVGELAAAEMELGMLYLANDDVEQAQELLRDAVGGLEAQHARMPHDFNASKHLATGLEYLAVALGSHDDARPYLQRGRQILEQLDEQLPGNAEVRRLLSTNYSSTAEWHARRGEYEMCLQQRRRALELADDQLRPACQMQLAICLVQLGETAEAEKILAEVASDLGANSAEWLLLARAQAILASSGLESASSSAEWQKQAAASRERAVELGATQGQLRESP